MLALIAGTGSLPGRVTTHLAADGRSFRTYALEGVEVALDPELPLRRFRVETLGSLLEELRSAGVRSVCFAGGVPRPPIDPAAIDAATLPLLERMIAAHRAGDDGALRVVLTLFEEAGLRIVGAHELAPDLLPGAGVPTVAKPSDGDGADAGRGEAIVAALGAVDVGQACVVAGGQALAVEAQPGTDWMLATLSPGRAAPARSATAPTQPDALNAGARRGVLYKAPKPNQDRRVDLPTIGEGTVAAADAAGLRGIVVEAGGVIVLDLDAVVKAADAAGLFLWIRDPAP